MADHSIGTEQDRALRNNGSFFCQASVGIQMTYSYNSCSSEDFETLCLLLNYWGFVDCIDYFVTIYKGETLN